MIFSLVKNYSRISVLIGWTFSHQNVVFEKLGFLKELDNGYDKYNVQEFHCE